MNAKLRNLLTLIGAAGVLIGGVSYQLFKANDGVTDAQLVDAGADACADVTLSCLVRSSKAGVCVDGSGNSLPGGSYCQLEVNGKNCGSGESGGVFPFPDVFDGGAELVPETDGTTCRTTANGKLPNGQAKKLASYSCACAPNPVGTCKWNGAAPPMGVTFAPSTWSGACQPKPCGSILAINDAGLLYDGTWPANCP